MKNLSDLLGVELPVIQAPMAGVQGSALAIAVSNAGGLGSLPCAMLTLENTRSEVAAIRQACSRPFNINFFCHKMPQPDVAREHRWRELLAPYYAEMGLSVTDIPAALGRASFDDAAADLLTELRPSVVSFHFGLPDAVLLARVKATGARILSSATTVDEARWLERHGVDAVIAQGVEAGGHRGMFLTDDVTTQVGTLALVSQVLDAVHVPVIAAGGIAEARGVAAALSLGAAAVQVGTAYLLCPEARTSALHRTALTSDAARHTALTNVFTGRAARSIVNRVMREIGPMSPHAPEFPLALGGMLPLRQAAEARSSSDFTPLWAGQNVSGCREVSAVELTRALVRGR